MIVRICKITKARMDIWQGCFKKSVPMTVWSYTARLKGAAVLYDILQEQGLQIIAFSDSNLDKWQKKFDHLEIIPPEAIKNTDFTKILRVTLDGKIYGTTLLKQDMMEEISRKGMIKF